MRGKRGKILKKQRSRRGGYYPFINLHNIENIPPRKNANVHTLVAEAFLGPRPEGMVVHHKDGNRDNCHLSNLEYVTLAENARLRVSTIDYSREPK